MPPIGIFDSGIGGLTVLKEITARLPQQPFVYFGDTARVPYGGKSPETVTRFSVENTEFLLTFGVKLIVVACHTASSLSVEALKKRFSLPIIGVVEPAAKKAATVTKNGRIGIIGTRATITSGAFERSLKGIDPKLRAFNAACPLFVSLVEEGWVEGEVTERVARTYLEPIMAHRIDTLILGCTHYPLLAKVIARTLKGRVELVNPAVETAAETARALGSADGNGDAAAGAQFFVSDEPEHFKRVGERFLERAIPAVELARTDERGAARA